MPSHDGQYGGGRGSDTGSFSAVVPQDWDFSRRICFFHLVAPDGGERRPDAVAKEGSPGGSARGNHGDGGRGAAEGTGGRRSEVGGFHRPDAVAAVDFGSASGIPDDFFAARCRGLR